MINLQLATKWQPGCPATSRPECAAPKWRAECATTRRPEWTAASWRPEWTATKWRHDVAMGVSPWNTNPHRAMSPEGTTGNPLHQTHVASSGLRTRFELQIHGFAPVATACRPFGTNVITPGRSRRPSRRGGRRGSRPNGSR